MSNSPLKNNPNYLWNFQNQQGGDPNYMWNMNNQTQGGGDPNYMWNMNSAPPPPTVGPTNTTPSTTTTTPQDPNWRWSMNEREGGGGFLNKIGGLLGGGGGIGAGLGSMAMPLGIGLSVAGSVIGAVKARKEQRRARKQAKKAKKELNAQMDAFREMDTSNPYLNMENTMEDLTINQKQSQFQKEQFQQSQANILDSLRGAAGGSGVAALAQQMAQSGQLAAQQSAADIGRQEASNQRAERAEAGRLQGLEIQGEYQKRSDDQYKTETLLGMAQEKFAAKKEMQAAAKQQKWDAITGGITGAANMFAGFGQGDGTTE
ncbi:MAG: hypothetical protein CMC70_12290 [Flavobacteriaceae bacterium]|nr:hypothetical protein [Flavobacteriaceae bacterium]